MYHLHLTISETVSGWLCRASLHDIDDTRTANLVATHGPLQIAREDEGESDLEAALRTAATYGAYLSSRHQITSGVAPLRKREKA
jgi:hypothetical protein